MRELPIQFADYAAWQAEWVKSDTVARQLEYWKRELAGASAFLPLPTDRPRPPMQSFRGARHWFSLSPAATASLRELCHRERVSLFMALLAAVQVLLSRYTGQEDILVWTPVANRMRKELEEMIGYFLNMLVLWGKLSGNPPFRELLRRTRETTLGALANQDLPLEKLVDVLQQERDQSYPLFQVLFVLQNIPMPNVEMSGLNVREFEVDSGTANFDLTISLTETPDGLTGRIEYATDLFDADRIERMAGHFKTLIEQVCGNPAERLSHLSLLTAEEREQLLVTWNQTGTDYRTGAGIHEMFESQAQRAPDRIALAKANDGVILESVNDKAGCDYRPKPYPGKIALFQPKRNFYYMANPFMGWREFANGGLKMIELPVYPGGMFVEPYVQALADKLRASIDETD